MQQRRSNCSNVKRLYEDFQVLAVSRKKGLGQSFSQELQSESLIVMDPTRKLI